MEKRLFNADKKRKIGLASIFLHRSQQVRVHNHLCRTRNSNDFLAKGGDEHQTDSRVFEHVEKRISVMDSETFGHCQGLPVRQLDDPAGLSFGDTFIWPAALQLGMVMNGLRSIQARQWSSI